MKLFSIILFFTFSLAACAQTKLTSDKSFVIMSYNVENLFDTINDPSTNDEDFLPTGKQKWTSERYLKKLDNLSKVIASPNEKNLPAIIGVYEIENKKVVEDLAATTKLKKGNYGVVHYDSPDQRGIDVAMLYRKNKFKVLSSKAIHVELPEQPPYPTRDILLVKGLAEKKDTLFFFMNHWPSRRNGADASEVNRIAAAKALRSAVDSIKKFSSAGAKIIIMGDFNDYPDNKSIYETLGVDTISNPGSKALFNLCYQLEKKDEGSYNYKDDWGMLDQFIISYSTLNRKGLHATEAKILKEDWMLYTNKETQKSKPNATYGGEKYFGGYSDHLPIYMELTK